MSEQTTHPPLAGRKWRWLVVVALGFAGGVAALCLWFSGRTIGGSDPVFRGQPESVWIKNLKYSDSAQVEEWRGYGEEGVQVLIRGLERATPPSGERAYRQLYRRMPAFVMRWLPVPKEDASRATRMTIVSLLSSLGTDAKSAVPVMIRTLNQDEAGEVRQSTINFFNSREDERCLLNQLPAAQKKEVLPALLSAVQDQDNWGLRNNAAIALRWYPEERQVVTPVLVAALKDPQPQVRLLVAEALNRVDPDAARKAGALAVVIAITKDPDAQIAHRAVHALRDFKSDAGVVVPVLIETLTNTNTLVACEAVWALEWSPPEFKSHAATIVPALAKAAERKDNVGGYAAQALKRFQSDANRPVLGK